MMKYHEDMLNPTEATVGEGRKSQTAHKLAAAAVGTPSIAQFCTTSSRTLKVASPMDQKTGELLLVQWIGQSLRPFTIVEDQGFVAFSKFLCNLTTEFKLPSRQTVRNHLVQYGKLVHEKMKELIQEKVQDFSMTTDIWSSRTMQSFMAVTMHAIDNDFNLINLTLAVQPLRGRHTAALISSKLEACFENWGLAKRNLTLMLRDNA
ncbi:MAG: hypothetical protein ACX936_21570, partial [Marinobacter sp.]